MQALDNNTVPRAHQAPGMLGQGDGAPTNNTSDRPAADPWVAAPEEFRATIPPMSPADIDKHDRVIGSLLAAAPPESRLPPIQNIPTSLEEEWATYRRICVLFTAFEPESRKAMITIVKRPSRRVTLDRLFLALTVFRQPSNIDAAVNNLAEVIKRMVARFRAWAREWGAAIPIGPCDCPEAAAVTLKDKAVENLEARFPVDDEARWLYALLRVVGDIPALWGYEEPDNNSGDAAAVRGGQGEPQQSSSDSSFDPVSSSAPSADSSTPGVQSVRIVGGGSQSQPISTHRVDAPDWQKHPAPPSSRFLYYNPHSSSTNQGESMFRPEPVPGPHSLTTGVPIVSASQGLGNVSSDFLRYREGNVSVLSLPSNFTAPRVRGSLASSQRRVDLLEDIVRAERKRTEGLEHLRDIAMGLSDFFFRGLFAQYSHQFMGAQMCQAYRAVALRAPNAMVPLVIRICKHMETDVEILSTLGKV